MLAFLTYPKWIHPVIIPGLPLRWYGLMYLVAFVITFLLFRYQIRQRKLDVSDDEIMNFIFWIIIGLLLGARIFATIVYDPTGRYLRHPWLIFWPFDASGHFTGLAGMSYHGGVIGVIIAAVIYCRVKKIKTLEWGDMLVTAVPLGYTFGRLGNFINAELYGRVTTFGLGMVFPTAQKFPVSEPWVQKVMHKIGMTVAAGQQMVNLPRHPSELYEAFFEGIVLWLIMWFIFRKRQMVAGTKVAIYIIGYGVFRFLIEYVREPDIGIGFPIKFVPGDNPIYRLMTPWNFTTGQILNFLMIIGGIAFLFIARYLDKRKPPEAPTQPHTMSMRKFNKKVR